MEAVGAPRKDVPFETYIMRNLKERLSPEAQTFALRMVEGYDAADPTRVSARAIVEEWTGEGTANDASYRPAGGYGALIGALAGELTANGGRLQLQTAVHAVHWKRGRVEVEGVHLGKPFRESASRAIVTLPLGVLQLSAGHAGRGPVLAAARGKEACARLPGVRAGDEGRAQISHRVLGGAGEAGVTGTPDSCSRPTRCFRPSGPRCPCARRFSIAGPAGRGRSAWRGCRGRRSCATPWRPLKTLFGKLHDVESQLETSYFHDWQRDPYARGAYAYVKAGGSSARKALAAPLKETLYFAGEASDYEGEAGTVAGALQSGTRAARQMLEAV